MMEIMLLLFGLFFVLLGAQGDVPVYEPPTTGVFMALTGALIIVLVAVS